MVNIRVLVTYGSTRGGTAGLAEMIGDGLLQHGFNVDTVPARDARRVDGHDAVVVGGAVYVKRWQREARQFVRRNAHQLRSRPVWLFSSGPLDDSAETCEIPPVPQVAKAMVEIGALGHATFGGRLEPTATGFPASATAKTHAGDWRNRAHVDAWTARIGDALDGDKARSDDAR